MVLYSNYKTSNGISDSDMAIAYFLSFLIMLIAISVGIALGLRLHLRQRETRTKQETSLTVIATNGEAASAGVNCHPPNPNQCTSISISINGWLREIWRMGRTNYKNCLISWQNFGKDFIHINIRISIRLSVFVFWKWGFLHPCWCVRLGITQLRKQQAKLGICIELFTFT
jgi:hypothetical protein